MSGFSGFTRLPRGFRLGSTSALRFYVFAQSNPIWLQAGTKVAQDGSRWPQESPSWGPPQDGVAKRFSPGFCVVNINGNQHISTQCKEEMLHQRTSSPITTRCSLMLTISPSPPRYNVGMWAPPPPLRKEKKLHLNIGMGGEGGQ